MATKIHTGVCPYCHSAAVDYSPVALPALALLRPTVMEAERALDMLEGRTRSVDFLEKCEMRT